MQTNPLRGFLSILSNKIGVLLLSLLITPALVRLLGSVQYGDYAFLLSLLGISMILVNAGINDGVRKFVAESRPSSSWGDDVFGFYTRLGTLLAGIAGTVLVGLNLSGITASLLGPVFEPYFYLLALLVVLRQYFSIARGSLMGKGLEHVSEPLRVIKRILFGAVGLTLAYVGYDVSGVLAGHLVATLLVTGIGFYFVSNQYELSAVTRPAPKGFPKRDLISFNTHSIILIFLTASLYHTDILLLQPLAGSSAVGYYKAALVIAEFLWFVPNALQTVLLHSTSEIWSRGNKESVTEIASRTARYTLVFSLLLVIGLAALADRFVPLYYGADFAPAIQPLLLLLPGALGFAVARPIFAIGQGKGDLRPLIVATGTAAVINLGLNLLLIPRYGMSGAAVATSVGYGSMLALHVIAARRIGYDPFAEIRVFRIAITAALAAPIIFGLAYLIGSRILSLLVVPPVGFVVYSVLALRTRAIAPEEIIPLLQSAPSPLSRWGTKVIRRID